MKKLLLFVAAFAFAAGVNAQENVLFEEDFENGMGNFISMDADGDGFSWGISSWPESELNPNTTQVAFSRSYEGNMGALTPDNWMVLRTPITLGENARVVFEVQGQDPSYAAEHFGVFVSEEFTTESYFGCFESVYEGEATPNWTTIEASLSEYAGKTVQVAIRHYDVTDLFIIKIDNFKIVEGESTAINDVRVDAQESDVWYDLQGRAYNHKPQAAGIYINNGKKVVVK